MSIFGFGSQLCIWPLLNPTPYQSFKTLDETSPYYVLEVSENKNRVIKSEEWDSSLAGMDQRLWNVLVTKPQDERKLYHTIQPHSHKLLWIRWGTVLTQDAAYSKKKKKGQKGRIFTVNLWVPCQSCLINIHNFKKNLKKKKNVWLKIWYLS